MMTKTKTSFLISAFLGAACAVFPGSLFAQAPPGPIHPASESTGEEITVQPPAPAKPLPPGRTSMDGAWKFNADDSDDAHQKLAQSGNSNGGGNGGGRGMGGSSPFPGGGPGGGSPYPGGSPGGGMGGHRGGMGGADSDLDRSQTNELLNPPQTLAFLKKSAEVDVTDDQGRRRIFYTDGRKLQKSKDDSNKEYAAHWDGSRLISEEKTSRGKITRTFELGQAGRQLYEDVHVDSGHSGSVYIHYVYDMTEEEAKK
jgi:hypothetical protein